MIAKKEIKIKNILNMLVLQGTKDNILSEDIDQQLNGLLETLNDYFSDNKLEEILLWLNEIITRETDLKIKQETNFRVYNKPSISILISKCSVLHAKIIEMITDEIDMFYSNFSENLLNNELDLARESKIMAMEYANLIIDNLNENRNINSVVYDNYVKIISQTLEIFKI